MSIPSLREREVWFVAGSQEMYGAAVLATVDADAREVAGAHADIYAAAVAMGRVRPDVHLPDPLRASAYDELYELYTRVHDHFGREERGLMRRLQAIRERAAP